MDQFHCEKVHFLSQAVKTFFDSKKDENPYLDIDTESGRILIKNSNQFDYEEKFNDLPIQIKAHVSDGGKIGKI